MQLLGCVLSPYLSPGTECFLNDTGISYISSDSSPFDFLWLVPDPIISQIRACVVRAEKCNMILGSGLMFNKYMICIGEDTLLLATACEANRGLSHRFSVIYLFI